MRGGVASRGGMQLRGVELLACRGRAGRGGTGNRCSALDLGGCHRKV